MTITVVMNAVDNMTMMWMSVYDMNRFYQLIKDEAYIFYVNEIKEDWQLQGCLVLFVFIIFMLLLINMAWRIYGPSIMEMELGKTPETDSTDNGAEQKENIPDEDPLTFTKK